MKKYLPYVFPSLAILIVMFLVFRWYKLNTQQTGEITQFAEGVEIEDLSSTKMDETLNGSAAYKTDDLKSFDEMSSGQIRYEVSDDKIKFSVYANLPSLDSGEYQVWLRDLNGETSRKAFILEESKGGFMGSAAISSDVLPFELVVSRETVSDEEIEKIILTGILNQE
ncbi:MAG: hypothetical protein ABFQ62_02085 [Patescibacteria group bacterium]